MAKSLWPDYCKKETLAKRLDIAIGMVDQMVKRGLLPAPIVVDNAHLWRWEDVDAYLTNSKSLVERFDPYHAGAKALAETSTIRS